MFILDDVFAPYNMSVIILVVIYKYENEILIEAVRKKYPVIHDTLNLMQNIWTENINSKSETK